MLFCYIAITGAPYLGLPPFTATHFCGLCTRASGLLCLWKHCLSEGELQGKSLYSQNLKLKAHGFEVVIIV